MQMHKQLLGLITNRRRRFLRLFWLLLSHLYHVTSPNGPQHAWEALLINFERDTLANKLF